MNEELARGEEAETCVKIIGKFRRNTMRQILRE